MRNTRVWQKNWRCAVALAGVAALAAGPGQPVGTAQVLSFQQMQTFGQHTAPQAQRQIATLGSGTVTVALTQGLDSMSERVTTVSEATVTASDTPAISLGTRALVQLQQDQAGGYVARLVELEPGGETLRTFSAHGTLVGGKRKALLDLLRAPDAPQDAVEGSRVFLPEHTLVRFVLTAPPTAPVPGLAVDPAPAPAAAAPAPPEHPPVTQLDLPPAAPGYPPLRASRPAGPGCWWTPFVSKRYGVEMPVQVCAQSSQTTLFNETDQGITAQNPGAAPQVIFTVESKPAAESMLAAIHRLFISHLTPAAARIGCRAVLRPQRIGAWQEYGIAPTAARARRFAGMQPGDDGPCGSFDDPDADDYFLYQPALSTTRFLYITGQTDSPNALPWDEAGIQWKNGDAGAAGSGAAPDAASDDTEVPEPKTLSDLLDRLSASATEFARYLPHFECEEQIHSTRLSQMVPFQRFTLPADVHATDEIEVQSVDGRLNETRTWLTQDGRPVPHGTNVMLPDMLTMAFGIPVPAYLSAANRSCLRFHSPYPGRVDFTSTANAGFGQCADIAPHAVGFITFDPRTMAVTHLQRTVPAAVALPLHFTPFAAVDYSPFRKDGDTRSYQLPSHIFSTQTVQGVTLTFDAHYVQCREFHTSVILRDAQGNLLPE